MTDAEKRRQKADLLLEFEETREMLAHLNEAAWKQKERIYEVSKWLEESRFFENSPNLTYRFEELNTKIKAAQELYREAMDLG